MKVIPKSALIIGIIGLVLIIFTRGFGFVCLTGFALMAWAAWAWWRAGTETPQVSKPDVVDYRSVMEPFKWKQIGKYSAIALDTDNKIVDLYENKQYRSYPFADIRRWSTNTRDNYATNFHTLRDNRNATGLFIEVRDIEIPQWRIEFPAKGKEQTHARWIEIFQQYVNES